MKEREETLIFGLVESAEELGKTKGEFVRDDDKESNYYSLAKNYYEHSTNYARAIGKIIADYNDEFTNADGFKNLECLDSYSKGSGHEYPLIYDYYKVIKQKENPLKTALKDISREQLSDVTLLTSRTSENPLLKPLQEVGIEVVRKKENSEIWFVLDGLDMDKATGKEAIEADDKNAHHYSALHHIYNDRDNLKKKVLFFEKNQRVHAPWEKNPELWNSRKQEKESQNKDQNPRALKDLIKAGERSPVSPPAKEQENKVDFASAVLSLKKRLERSDLDVKNDGIKTKTVHSR
jgi:hypothetical protein